MSPMSGSATGRVGMARAISAGADGIARNVTSSSPPGGPPVAESPGTDLGIGRRSDTIAGAPRTPTSTAPGSISIVETVATMAAAGPPSPRSSPPTTEQPLLITTRDALSCMAGPLKTNSGPMPDAHAGPRISDSDTSSTLRSASIVGMLAANEP